MKYKNREYLFKKSEWCDISELTGEENVLNSSLIEEAFEKILKDYHPYKKYAIFSLCTSSRPYMKSRKWSMFERCFSKSCELIVCSNGGIIPMEYMNCFPFLEYDAPHTSRFTSLYKDIFLRRLDLFLQKFKFEKIVFVFTPASRNYEALQCWEAFPSNARLLPDINSYTNIKQGINDLYIGVSQKRDILCTYTVLVSIRDFFMIPSPYILQLEQRYIQKEKPSMDLLFSSMIDTLEEGKGYTLEELVTLIKNISDIYSIVYIRKTIKAHTLNIPSEFNKKNDLIFLEGYFYKYQNLSEKQNKKCHKKLF